MHRTETACRVFNICTFVHFYSEHLTIYLYLYLLIFTKKPHHWSWLAATPSKLEQSCLCQYCPETPILIFWLEFRFQHQVNLLTLSLISPPENRQKWCCSCGCQRNAVGRKLVNFLLNLVSPQSSLSGWKDEKWCWRTTEEEPGVQLILTSVLFSPIPTIAMKKTRIFTGMIRTYVVYRVTEDLATREGERRALKSDLTWRGLPSVSVVRLS